MSQKFLAFLFSPVFLLLCLSCSKEELNEDSLSGDWVVESSNETVIGFWGYATFMKGDLVHFDQTDNVRIIRRTSNEDNQIVFDFRYRINNRSEKESYLEVMVSQYYAVDQAGIVTFHISKSSKSSLYLNKVYNRLISDEVVILKQSH